MPARVVDDLELVQIEIQHGVDTREAVLFLEGTRQLVFEVVPVSQPGEGIVGGLILEPGGEGLLLGQASARNSDSDRHQDYAAKGRENKQQTSYLTGGSAQCGGKPVLERCQATMDLLRLGQQPGDALGVHR